MIGNSMARFRISLCILILLCCGLLSIWSRSVTASDDGPQVHDIKQRDLDGDGQLDLTVISCSFATEHDLVHVYDQGKDMTSGTNWFETTDFDNDIWIFDTKADGNVELIVVFDDNEELAIAYVYDDRNGDSNVSFRLSGSKIEITESPYWTVKVVADPGWRLPDGSVNLNVQIWIDGLTEWHWHLLGEHWPDWVLERVLNDGKEDRVFEVVDSNLDGVAEYALERLLTPSPPGGVFSARLYVNEGRHRSLEYDHYAFWPFLVGTHQYEIYNYFDHPPVISVDWLKAKVDRTDLIGYPIEEGYHINSWEPWEKGKINYANFENPMAYYDMANDSDGDPELFVRLETYRPYDQNILEGRFPQPLVEAEYVWDQDNNDMTFDYQMSLLGRHPIDSGVWFRDFGVEVVPHAELPWWVSDRTWDAAVFTVAEDGGSRGSEGMYSWLVSIGLVNGVRVGSGLKRFYITGIWSEPPTWAYAEIGKARRGEVSYHFASRPYLYFSPIDRKLHIPMIDYGLWNVDGVSKVEYADLDADGFIDQWRYSTNEELQKTLIAASGTLIYVGDGKVLLKQVDVAPALFETLPPHSHDEWLALDQQLEAHRRDFAPTDFEAMVAQFGEPTTCIKGATLRDFRSTGTGFRFALELHPGFRVDGEDLLGILEKAPGTYVASYEGTFQTQPLSPPILQIGPVADTLLAERPTAYVPGEVQFTLHNRGLEDAKSVSMTATMIMESDPGRSTAQVVTQTVTVLAGGAVPVRFEWTPESAGTWLVRLEAQAVNAEGAIVDLAIAEQEVEVRPAEEEEFWQVLSAFGLSSPGAVLLLLASVAVVSALVGLALSHTLTSE